MRILGKIGILIYAAGFIVVPLATWRLGLLRTSDRHPGRSGLWGDFVVNDLLWLFSPLVVGLVVFLVGAGCYGLYSLWKQLDPPPREDRIKELERQLENVDLELTELRGHEIY